MRTWIFCISVMLCVVLIVGCSSGGETPVMPMSDHSSLTSGSDQSLDTI